MRLDSLNPLERLAHVATRRLQGGSLDPFAVLSTIQIQAVDDPFGSVIREEVSRLLAPVLVLEAFAIVSSEKLQRAERLYLLDDSAVIKLAEQVGVEPEQSWNVHLEMLACTGLIFRFPVALKFGYRDRSLTQVRSNSWGSLAFEEFGLVGDTAFKNTVTLIRSIVENHLELYVELINACQSMVRPLNFDRIHNLNKLVPIPIVT